MRGLTRATEKPAGGEARSAHLREGGGADGVVHFRKDGVVGRVVLGEALGEGGAELRNVAHLGHLGVAVVPRAVVPQAHRHEVVQALDGPEAPAQRRPRHFIP